MYDQLKDSDWLKKQYVDEVRTLQQIADEVGCHKKTVWKAMKRHNIERRKHTSRHRLLNDKGWLHNAYVIEERSTKSIADEVGTSPGNIHDHLSSMGIQIRPIRDAMKIKFPDGQSGEKAGNWQGGKVIRNGYVLIYTPNHPAAKKGHPYVQEHRLVMEEQLGRYLEPYEVVHHKDGDRQNNDPSNLVVKTRGRHVSEHFKASHEVLQMRIENAELKEEIDTLKARIAELERLTND